MLLSQTLNHKDNQNSFLENVSKRNEPNTAIITAIDTAPVKSLFPNSIIECPDSALVGVNDADEHFGQVGQPNPEPDNRTLAPVTIIAPIKKQAIMVK